MSGPHPAVAAARGAVAASLADLPPEALVLVACSGGPDSLALAAATAHVARRSARHALRDGGAVLRLRAGAVVVDHGLRAGSAEVASRAARRCRELGLDPVLVETVDVGTEPGAGGPEGAARSARYAALERAARETGAAAVLLGHSLDDQAETVLLALARGAGGRALSGMAPVRGILRRPLLALRRSELRAACEAAGLEPDEDPTNAPDGPWRAADGSPLRRSAVRHGALPALSGAVGLDVAPALTRTAHRLRADEDLLDGLADDLWRSCAARAADGAAGCANGGDGANSAHGADGHVRLDVAALRAAHPALRSRVLHRALVAVGARAGDLSHRHVAALEGLLARGGRGAADLPGARAWRETGAGADGRAGGRSDARGCGTLVVTSSAHEIGVLEMRTRGAVDGREGHGRGPREGAAERGADPHPPR